MDLDPKPGSLPVLGIRIRMILCLPDPDPLVRDPFPDPDPSLFSKKVLSGLK
jgi:hypothetical protein